MAFIHRALCVYSSGTTSEILSRPAILLLVVADESYLNDLQECIEIDYL